MFPPTRTENIGTPDKMRVILELGRLNPYPVVGVNWIIAQMQIPLRFQEYPTYMVLKVFRCMLLIAEEMTRSTTVKQQREPLYSTEFLDGLGVLVCCERGVSSLIVDWGASKVSVDLNLEDLQLIVDALDQTMSEFTHISGERN